MGVRLENGKYYIDEDYIIKRQRHIIGAPSHTHDFIELEYFRKGHCTHIIDGCSYTVGKGDMVFVNYNSVHTLPPDGNAEYTNILIKPEFIDRSLQGSENAFSILALKDFQDFAATVQRGHFVFHFSGKEQSQIENLLDRMEEVLSSNSMGSNLVIHSCINILLTMVFRKMDLPMKQDRSIGSALLNEIRSNCSAPLSLEQIAAKVGYSPSYFSRIFKKFTGQNYMEYVTGCKLSLAMELLENTSLRVEDIMSEAGFSDRTKFFKLFQSKTTMTPLQYRKSKIQEP